MSSTILYREKVPGQAAPERELFSRELPEGLTSAPARDVIAGYARHQLEEMRARASEYRRKDALPRIFSLREFHDGGAPAIDAMTTKDAEQEALSAFEKGRILFFWNGGQITSLDQTLAMKGRNEAVFIYLTPLQGG